MRQRGVYGSQPGRADPVNRLPIAGLTDYLFLSIVFAIEIVIVKDTEIVEERVGNTQVEFCIFKLDVFIKYICF